MVFLWNILGKDILHMTEIPRQLQSWKPKTERKTVRTALTFAPAHEFDATYTDFEFVQSDITEKV